MPNLRITLYDLFGYFLPGTVFLGAILITFWAIFLTKVPLQRLPLHPEILGAGLVLAYVAGHVAQALSNLAEVKLPSLIGSLSAPLVNAAQRQVQELSKTGYLTKELVYELADEFLVQRGVRENREIYVYREGFYRGMATSFLALTVSLIVRAFAGDTAVTLPSGVQLVRWPVFVFLVLACAASIACLWARYHRFARLRVVAALAGVIALPPSKPKEDSDGV